jgi:SnoaL-like domain
VADRLAQVEAHQAIQQLPIRYAMAIDARDIDEWLRLFAPDIDLGRRGRGREALRAYIEPAFRSFYRSIHFVCGHRIEITKGLDRATGAVYCRAEHEVGQRWVVMGIRYDDEYQTVDGEWLFTRRKERYWYAADMLERPQAVAFKSWETSGGPPSLPHALPTWLPFWSGEPSAFTSSP